MDVILKKDTCRDFLKNYYKEIYPILVPNLLEIGILTLKLSFNKVFYTPDELNDIITSLKEQYKNKKASNINKKPKKINKLPNKYSTSEIKDYLGKNQQKNFLKTIPKTISFNETNISKNDDRLNTIDSSNFYDSNYIIPESKKYRNKQLYNKRLENPKFNTLNKCVYPFWWWNQTEHNYLNTNTAPSYIKNPKLKKIFKSNQNPIHKRSNKKHNYFVMANKTNYKISYDKNLNVIKVETTGERKTKTNKI